MALCLTLERQSQGSSGRVDSSAALAGAAAAAASVGAAAAAATVGQATATNQFLYLFRVFCCTFLQGCDDSPAAILAAATRTGARATPGAGVGSPLTMLCGLKGA